MTAPIGTTKGPGETHHEYLFITPDRGGMEKVDEFVCCETEVDGQAQRLAVLHHQWTWQTCIEPMGGGS